MYRSTRRGVSTLWVSCADHVRQASRTHPPCSHRRQPGDGTRRAGTREASGRCTRGVSQVHYGVSQVRIARQPGTHVQQASGTRPPGIRVPRRVNKVASAVSRSMHTAARTTEIAAIAVYQVDRHSKCDRILLEERVTPALCCGGACGTIGFPGGKVDEEDQGSLRRTMQRELREELVFTDKGAPHQVQPVGPVGRVELGPFRISLFTARIPPTATVACTPEYHPRVKALHWRRPTAIRNSTDPRMMPSTELLLDMVPFPPPSHTGTGKAQTVGVDLPSSGRVPRQPNAPRKRKRAAARGE